MAVNHEQELREMAQRASELAALIIQDGRPANQFQTAVFYKLPKRAPDAELRNIEIALGDVARLIENYLQHRGG